VHGPGRSPSLAGFPLRKEPRMKAQKKPKLNKKTIKNLRVKLSQLAVSPFPVLDPSNSRSC
jgi:hypothetical protein